MESFNSLLLQSRRDLSTEISRMLTFIFQQSCDTGTLPGNWLIAMVVPVLHMYTYKIKQW